MPLRLSPGQALAGSALAGPLAAKKIDFPGRLQAGLRAADRGHRPGHAGLLRQASALEEVDKAMKQLLNKQVIDSIVALIPEDWITATFPESVESVRNIYSEFLQIRLESSETFVKQAIHARASII